MTDYEARKKIYDRLCKEYRKGQGEWLSRESLCGELNLTVEEYNRAVDWMSPITKRVGGRMIIETQDASELRLGVTGRRWLEDETEPELLD